MVSLGKWMWVLESPWFKYCGISFLATIFSLIVKLSSRANVYTRREDWAVGFDLAQVSIFAVLTDGSAGVIRALAAGQREFPSSVVASLIGWTWLLVFMVGLLFVSALLVRGHGWRKSATGDEELNGWGLYGPLALGIGYMGITVLWMGG